MLISVVMSVYNEPVVYIREAVESVMQQTYRDIELVAIVDNPDNTDAIKLLENYRDSYKNIKIHINDHNIGLARSLNIGIRLSSGDLIARMDADDRSLPNRLEREYEFLKAGNYGMVSCLVERIDSQGRVWGELKPFPNESKVIMGMLPAKNVVIHPTVLMKRSIVEELGGYRPYSSAQDHDLWLRMLSANVRIGILNEKLFQFRMHPNSVSSTKGYSQYLNEKHMKKMYKERCKKGTDNFSEVELESFLNKNGFDDISFVEKQNRHLQDYRQGVADVRNHKKLEGYKKIVQSLICSPCVRDNLSVTIQSKILRRRYS